MYTLESFKGMGILEDGFEGISAVARSGESRVAEGWTSIMLDACVDRRVPSGGRGFHCD